MNPAWTKQLIAAVSQHFDSALPNLFITGQFRNTEGQSDFSELRISGPDWFFHSKNHYLAKLLVQVLVQSTMNDSNYYRIYDTLGTVQAAYTGIQVSGLGCLQLLDPIRTRYIGQVNERLNLVQAYVQAWYEIDLAD